MSDNASTPSPAADAKPTVSVIVNLDSLPADMRGDLAARAQLSRRAPSDYFAELVAKALGANQDGSPLIVRAA